MIVFCDIRGHSDLKYRNPDIPIEDLPLSMQNAYKDAVERGCMHVKAPRYTPMRKEEVMETTVTEVPETEGLTGPADETPKVTIKVARKPKTCSVCNEQGHNKRTHAKRTAQPQEAVVETV